MNVVRSLLHSIYQNFFSRNSVQDHIKRGLTIGRNFNIQRDVIIDYSHTWHIEIGDDVTLAPRVVILAHDASTRRNLGYTRLGKVKIGSRVFIGAASIILPGVTIGDDVIVGAGSVVSSDVPSGSVAVGNPARVVRSIESFLAEKANEISCSPCFDEAYTLRMNVSDAMKHDMNNQMKDGIGYVV